MIAALMMGGPFGKAHEWTDCPAPHPGLKGCDWMRSKCGRIERREDLFTVRPANGESACKRCLPPAQGTST